MSGLTRIIRTLEERELLTRSVCPEDQRAGVLTLTGKGKAVFSSIIPDWDKLYDAIESKYGHERLRTLYQLLEELELCMDTLGQKETS